MQEKILLVEDEEADDYISKPFSLFILEKRMEHC